MPRNEFDTAIFHALMRVGPRLLSVRCSSKRNISTDAISADSLCRCSFNEVLGVVIEGCFHASLAVTIRAY